MRTIWNGVISFGLVNIPVGLYPATKEDKISFNLLHDKDHGRIKQQRVCTVCNEVLDTGDLIKGFEYAKGEYVSLTEDEIKSAQGHKSESIDILGFVDIKEIDPIFFDTPYYLSPNKHGAKPYSLLREALKKSGRAGIATFTLRNREVLAAVRVKDNALVLNTMHFAQEIREAEGVTESEISKPELDIALQLVQAMGTHFEAEKFHDTYKESLMATINQKLKGKKVTTKQAAVPAQPQVLDLMERLKQSLGQAENGKGKKAPAKSTAKAPAKKTPARKPKEKEHLRLVA